MADSRLLVAAMAAKCRDVIRGTNEEEKRLPKGLHPKHLLWMCDQVVAHEQEWPVTRLHRWIGFIQCGVLANQMLTFDQVRGMFDELKESHGVSGEDQDLIDHLDASGTFELDIGGQG